MKNKRLSIIFRSLLAILVASSFYSCGKKMTAIDLIPKDAAMVFTIDAKNISNKAAWDAIFSKTRRQPGKGGVSEDEFKNSPDNPMNWGISFYDKMHFFAAQKDNAPFAGITFYLTDAAKFESTIKHLAEKQRMPAGDAKDEDGYRSISIFGGVGYVTWKNNVAMILVGMGASSKLAGFCSEMYKGGSDKSIQNDADYKMMADKGADLSFWYKPQQWIIDLISNAGGAMGDRQMMESMKQQMENFKDVSAMLTFGDGVIDLDMVTNMTDKGKQSMGDILKPVTKQAQYASMAGSKPIMAFGIGFTNKLVDEVMKNLPFQAREEMERAGVSQELIKDLLSGEFFFTINELMEVEKESFDFNVDPNTGEMVVNPVMKKEAAPVFALTTGSSDAIKSFVERMVGSEREVKVLSEKGKDASAVIYEGPMDQKSKGYLSLGSTELTFSNDKQLALGNYPGGKNEVLDRLSKYPVFGYFDITTLIAKMPESMKQDPDFAQGKMFFDLLSHVEMFCEVKGNAFETDVKLIWKDKKNVLAQLLEMAEKLSQNPA